MPIEPDSLACLDACVLASQNVCDLLLRLAEEPRLYRPVFSEQILQEVRRVQTTVLKRPFPEELADYWHQEVTRSFPGALIEGYSHIVPQLKNAEEDRHVLAAAIHGQARFVITYNLRDFPSKHLDPWGVRAIHPAEFLIAVTDHSPQIVGRRIADIAEHRNCDPSQVLDALSRTVPAFVEHVKERLFL